MKLPPHWLRHTIVVEPYLGEAGTKPLYGPPRRVRCHLEPMQDSQRRGPDRGPGEGTRCIAEIEHADLLVLDSRITVDGRVVELRSRQVRTAPGLPVPEHVELTLV